MVKSIAWLTALANMLLSSPAHADFSFSGSMKNLTVGTRSMVNNDPYLSNLSRLRLAPRYRRGAWTLDAAYDLELLTGSFLDSPEFLVLNDAPDPRYWELQNQFYESNDLVARHQLYRGTVQWRSSVGDFRLGRQQVNWSTALIWNPMDILNPVSPLQLEPDERIGVDALLWDTPWGALGRISAVYAPQHEGDQASTAVRAKRFIAGIDASVMTGTFADVTKAGVSGSGSLAGTGWRTEAVWSERDTEEKYWQAVADLNWSFRNGINLAVEYFYNGLSKEAPDLSRLAAGEPQYAGHHYTGLLFWQDITPFWQYRVIGIRNANDHSWVFYPRSTWTLPTPAEVYFTVGMQIFGGDDNSEFGRLNTLGLLELQWFF